MHLEERFRRRTIDALKLDEIVGLIVCWFYASFYRQTCEWETLQRFS